jgi:hypothetical protein
MIGKELTCAARISFSDVINYDALLAGLEWVACVAETVVVVDLLVTASRRTVPCALVAGPGREIKGARLFSLSNRARD